MHAFLYIGSTDEFRAGAIRKQLQSDGVSIFDTVSVIPEADTEHVGISAIRDFKARLQLAPAQSPFLAGVIERAHLLTVESQNALLKLLEEPPAKVKIYMETANEDALLPTIRSRCLTIRVDAVHNTTDQAHMKETLLALSSGSPGVKLQLITAIAEDRVQAKAWVHSAQTALHELLLEALSGTQTSLPKERCVRLMRLLSQAASELSVNVNPKLVLDTVFLSL